MEDMKNEIVLKIANTQIMETTLRKSMTSKVIWPKKFKTRLKIS